MFSRTSAATWSDSLLRLSNMVSTMPWISSVRIEIGAHQLDGLQQLAQAFQREELALQRHHHRIGRRHGVDGEQA